VFVSFTCFVYLLKCFGSFTFGSFTCFVYLLKCVMFGVSCFVCSALCTVCCVAFVQPVPEKIRLEVVIKMQNEIQIEIREVWF